VDENRESEVYITGGNEAHEAESNAVSPSNGKPFDLDDKDFVILAVVILCVVSIWAPENIILNAFSGLFGIAVGRSIR